MNEEAFQAWIRTLRSGEYKQGRTYLYSSPGPGKDTYCCLGVACVLTPDLPITDWEYKRLAPREVIDWLDLRVPSQSLGTAEYDFRPGMPETLCDRTGDWSLAVYSASLLNDQGFTFPQIADIFEHFGIAEVLPR